MEHELRDSEREQCPYNIMQLCYSSRLTLITAKFLLPLLCKGRFLACSSARGVAREGVYLSMCDGSWDDVVLLRVRFWTRCGGYHGIRLRVGLRCTRCVTHCDLTLSSTINNNSCNIHGKKWPDHDVSMVHWLLFVSVLTGSCNSATLLAQIRAKRVTPWQLVMSPCAWVGNYFPHSYWRDLSVQVETGLALAF